METVKKRLLDYLKYLNIGQQKFEQSIGMSNGWCSKVGDSIRKNTLDKIQEVYPGLNITWLITGSGSMLISKSLGIDENDTESENYVLLLPISAQGGSLNEFVVSVKDSDCEKIISPIAGAEYAITISGDSMAPEYPNGSQILIKRINERAFIDWGKAYVLDTCNGVVVKILVPSPKDKNAVRCLSLNPDPKYAPFEVNLNDVYGIYRVLLCMSVK